MPRKGLSQVEYLGRGAIFIASTFSLVGKMPSTEITHPMYVTVF